MDTLKNTPDDKDVLDSMLEDQENKYTFVSLKNYLHSRKHKYHIEVCTCEHVYVCIHMLVYV